MSDKNYVQDMDEQILNRMLQDFLEEARDQLDYLNLILVQLEEEPSKEALIDEIFRTVHTLKGSAAFAGLKEISEISRKMEEVFGNVRKGTIKITSPFINIMYEGVDILTIFIEKAADNDGPEVDASWILEKLDQISDKRKDRRCAQ